MHIITVCTPYVAVSTHVRVEDEHVSLNRRPSSPRDRDGNPTLPCVREPGADLFVVLRPSSVPESLNNLTWGQRLIRLNENTDHSIGEGQLAPRTPWRGSDWFT